MYAKLIVRQLILPILLIVYLPVLSQYDLKGITTDQNGPVLFATVRIDSLKQYTLSDSSGHFRLTGLPEGSHTIRISANGYTAVEQTVSIPFHGVLSILLTSPLNELDEMVVSGTMKEVSKLESTVNVEVFTPQFFRKDPGPSVFEALQHVNGVRPQLNCNICNTGDIHINGLEGPYTMILIDGMPIVSSLSTVYGLSGIPNSLVERIEIVKGPASALYGSEAVGGIINIITKKPECAPRVSGDVFTTTWLETNVDLATRFKVGQKTDVLTGINYYAYKLPRDDNEDGFTDVTLQDRISVFQKWNFAQKDSRQFTIAGRYLYEDRWGGQTKWTGEFRGSDSLYAESIYTSRWEIIGRYQLPLKERFFFSLSLNGHSQNSYYGTLPFMAKQFISFGQLHWDKTLNRHSLLAGVAFRYTHYDDNTVVTQTADSIPSNLPVRRSLPGIFLQDEIRLTPKQKLLLGIRYDYYAEHGSILTPRLGYKLDYRKNGIFRLNAGSGYRVVNVFTEDHAALTGARKVVIEGDLSPETSWNINTNLYQSFKWIKKYPVSVDFTAFYTYFNNRIIADYESDPDEIRFSNLSSYAVSQGISLKLDTRLFNWLKIQIGGTLMDNYSKDGTQKKRQLLTEHFNGNWSISTDLTRIHLTIDYTGNLYSPMQLPLPGDLDPRPRYSPWWSIQNIQFTWKGLASFEFYAGVKNLLNWTPSKHAPFLIARSNDPFDKQVSYASDGSVIATADNPYALTFDPSYVYAPNQGIRGFLGIRYTLK